MEYELDTEKALETHLPCPNCPSSDALSRYHDHTWCFSCETWTPLKTDDDIRPPKRSEHLIDVDIRGIRDRKISDRVCQKFQYGWGNHKGKKVQIAQYRSQSGEIVSQKLRTANKDFYVVGNHSNVQLFGQHLWQPGKRLVITEGEIDALSYAEISDCRWPVVSISSGAASAVTAIKKNIEFVEGFDEIVLMFDMDDKGQDAARNVSDILTPGKASIASLTLKDASEMLMAGMVKELSTAVFNAQKVRPDGIINGKEIWNEVSRTLESGSPYPWSKWNACLYGARPRELLVITAGSGVGKSTICCEIAHQFGVEQGKKVGYVALEESIGRTGQRLMSIAAGFPLHLPNEATVADKKSAFDATLGTGNFFLYDHFGSIDSKNLIRKLNYMVAALGVEVIILDHLSILVSGLEAESLVGGDERKAIDYTMTELRSFCERTNVCLFVVSHLRRSQSEKGHEGGEKVYLSHLRGSQAIAHLADAVVSVSRDMTNGDNELEVTCLKNRYAGITGDMGTLAFNSETGRLTEVPDHFGDNFDGKTPSNTKET